MVGRWVVVAVLFSSVAQAEVPLEVEPILDRGTRVWLKALNAKGKQLWRREVTKTDLLVFRSDIALLELDGTNADGSAISESLPVSLDPSVFRVSVLIMPGHFNALTVVYRAKPPASLVVTIAEADDVTGRGVVRVANQTSAAVDIIDLRVHPATSWRAPDFMPPMTEYQVKAGAEQTFEFDECSLPLSRGPWRRVVRVAQGAYLYLFEFPFVARGGEVPVLFPEVPVADLEFNPWSETLSAYQSTGRFRLCDGAIVGRERRRVRRQGQRFCTEQPDGGACAGIWTQRDVGDFAPFMPIPNPPP